MRLFLRGERRAFPGEGGAIVRERGGALAEHRLTLSKRVIGFSLRLGQLFVSLPQVAISLGLSIKLDAKLPMRLFECGERGALAGEGGVAVPQRGSALTECGVALGEGLVRLELGRDQCLVRLAEVFVSLSLSLICIHQL